jgi:ribonuclease P protein component
MPNASGPLQTPLPNDLELQGKGSPLHLEATAAGPGRRTGKFPKSARLLTSSQYKYLHRNSMRHFGESISVDVRQGRSFTPKLGITVSRKFGKAHDRNRFKRVVREAFRALSQSLPPDLEMNISPRKSGSLLTKQAILLELRFLLAKIVPS